MANTTVNIDIQVQSKSLVALEAELQAINDELKQVPIGSQAFNDLSQEAQQVTKQLTKAQQAAEGFTDDKKFLAADGAIKVLGGSLAGVVGVLGTLGVESEAFGEFERKAASAIAVAVGLKDLSEGFKQIKDSAALATIQAKIFGSVSKKALIATGIGAFVVALGTVVAYWDEIVDYVSGTNDELETQNSLLEKQISEGEIQLELLRLNRNAAQLRGESEELIVEDIKKQLLLEQEQYKQLVDNLTIQLEREAAASREITLWEKIKIGASMAVGGVGAYASAVADAVSPSEKVAELQERLNEARKGAASIDVQLAALEKEKTDRETKAFEERQAREQKEREAAEQAEKDRLQALEDIRTDYAERRRDDAAITNEQQVDLEKTRALEEITRLQGTEEQKLDIINYYNSLLADARAQDAKDAKDIADKEAADAIAAKIAEKEGIVAIEQAKFGLLSQAAGLAQELAGENEAVQIAAVIAQQAAAIGQIVSATGLANAKAVAVSPLTFGQPWVTINTISAGLSIATAVAQARKSIQQIKSAKSGGAPSGGQLPSTRGAAASAAPTTGGVEQIQAPQVITTTPTVQAYVLSGNVTSAQEADARLSTRRNIG